MKVTSKKSITFPKFKWGVNKGEVRELPADKEAAEAILAHPAISEVGKEKPAEVKAESKVEDKVKENK